MSIGSDISALVRVMVGYKLIACTVSKLLKVDFGVIREDY